MTLLSFGGRSFNQRSSLVPPFSKVEHFNLRSVQCCHSLSGSSIWQCTCSDLEALRRCAGNFFEWPLSLTTKSLGKFFSRLGNRNDIPDWVSPKKAETRTFFWLGEGGVLERIAVEQGHVLRGAMPCQQFLLTDIRQTVGLYFSPQKLRPLKQS